MVNVDNKQYVFHPDNRRITIETVNPKVLSLCEKYAIRSKNECGYFTYKEDEKTYIATYSYMSKSGLLFIMKNNQEEVFSSIRSVRNVIMYICAIAAIVLIIFILIIIRFTLVPKLVMKIE